MDGRTVYYFVYRIVVEDTMPTARILESDRQLLQGLARETGKQQQQIIHEALAQYHREHLLDEINAAFEKLRADPEAWGQEMEEREAWDDAAADGFKND
jgi:hypothetical protein